MREQVEKIEINTEIKGMSVMCLIWITNLSKEG